MPENGRKALRRPRRRGAALVFVSVTIVAMMGICSLAVDFGRVVVAKSELQRVVDGAARAGAAALSTINNTPTNTSVTNAVLKIVNMPNNTVNGATISLVTAPPRGGTSDVQWGIWNTTTHTFTAQPNVAGANAVQVTASLTSAKGNAIPLMFAKILGANSCNVHVAATAMWHSASWTPSGLPTKDSRGNSIITAKGNIYLAGQSNGVTASVPWDPTNDYNQTTGANTNSRDKASHPWEHDIYGTYGGTNAYGQPYETPAQAFTDPTSGAVTTQLVPGATIVVTNVTGNATNVNSGAPDYTADGSRGGTYNVYSDVAATDSNVSSYTGEGNSGSNTINGTKYSSVVGSEHGISNISAPLNSLLGVFLSDKTPDGDSANPTPPGMDFSTGTARNYTTLSLQTKQAFYIGDGENTNEQQQSFTVPPNATRLFLGTMDGQEWSNNQGGYSMTISQYWITLVK